MVLKIPNKNKHNALSALGRVLRTRPCYCRYMHVLRVSIIVAIFLPMVSISSEQEPHCDVQELIDELSEKKSIENVNEIEELWAKILDEACLKSTAQPVNDETLREFCGDEPCAILQLSKEE